MTEPQPQRSRLAILAAAVLALVALVPAPVFADHPPPPPYLWSLDAPLTRNQTVQLSFIGYGAIATQYLVSNNPALTPDGVLANGAAFGEEGGWTLAAGPDGPRTVYGQIGFGDGSWTEVLSLDFELVTGKPSSLYIDRDAKSGSTTWTYRSRTPTNPIYGFGLPLESATPHGFAIYDEAWMVRVLRTGGPLSPGTYTIGSSSCDPVCASVERTVPARADLCDATDGTITVHEVELATGDVRTADVDFRLVCAGLVVAGSVRYGSERPVLALDQSHGSLGFPATVIGETSAAQSVTFTNTGDVSLTFGQAVLDSGANFPGVEDYSITSDGCSGATIAAGTNCAIALRLAPSGIGNRHAILTIPDQTPRASRRIYLLGSGLQPTTLELALPGGPLVAPGPFTLTMTITPPTHPWGPQFSLSGSTEPPIVWSVQELSNPARRAYSTTVELPPGTYTVSAVFEESGGYLGSTAGPLTFTVGGDTSPPVGTISINGGAQYTNSTAVNLSVPASDPQSGVTHVALTGDPTLSWWSIRNYGASQSWNLDEGDGSKTVWVKWRNGAGVWSSVKSASIVLDRTPPTVSGPTMSIVRGSAVNNGLVRLHIEWSGTDAAAGINAFDLGQSTDGGSWLVVANGLKVTNAERDLAVRRAYRFRARGSDMAGNVSPWVAGEQRQLRRFQEKNAKITYRGTWKTASKSVFWGGAARRTKAAGATASMTFTGTAFGWVSRTGPNRGRAEILVNGSVVETVDLYAPTYGSRRIVWARSWPTVATRTVTVRSLATPDRPRIDVDAFITLN